VEYPFNSCYLCRCCVSFLLFCESAPLLAPNGTALCFERTTLSHRKLGRIVKLLFPNSLCRAMSRSRALDCKRWSASAAGFFSAGCHYVKSLTRRAPHTDARAPGWGVDEWLTTSSASDQELAGRASV